MEAGWVGGGGWEAPERRAASNKEGQGGPRRAGEGGQNRAMTRKRKLYSKESCTNAYEFEGPGEFSSWTIEFVLGFSLKGWIGECQLEYKGGLAVGPHDD